MASKIEWTEATWNPSSGCTKISSGCKNCYAKSCGELLAEAGWRVSTMTVAEVVKSELPTVLQSLKTAIEQGELDKILEEQTRFAKPINTNSKANG